MRPTDDVPPRRRSRLWVRSGQLVLTLLGVLSVPLLTSTGCLASFGQRPDPAQMAAQAKQSRFEDGRFVNAVPKDNAGPDWKVMKQFFFSRGQRVPPGALPMENPRAAWQRSPEGGLRVTWLGHSTLLVEVDGKRVLTDPIWGERASPSTLVGPKRFHPPVVALEELPPLDAVVISHDHYDHLDMPTIRALAKTEVPFFVPLGVASHLESWGVPRARITELDWWGEAKVGEGEGALTLVATPARHFSGRGLADRDCTLWASWVLRTARHRVYFSGDTGLTPQFAEIRERQGPFDLVMLEVGAFHPSWGDIHLGPDNAVRALELLGGGPLLPIHWGTFNLALHDWNAPGERLLELSKEQGFTLLTPRLGVPLEVVAAPGTLDAWWRQVRPDAETALSRAPSF